MDTSKHLGDVLKEQMPNVLWNGRSSILEMKEGGSNNWRQMEWIGFYFQFICKKLLCEVMEIPGPKYGETEFGGFLEIPWVFKAHAMNSGSHDIIVNDRDAVVSAVQNFGGLGLVLALGNVEYDTSGEFQRWHSNEKGGPSKYEMERIARGAPSRKRKESFALQQIAFTTINEDILNECRLFQEGLRNSDGSSRRPKILINLKKLNEDDVYFIDYCESNIAAQ